MVPKGSASLGAWDPAQVHTASQLALQARWPALWPDYAWQD